MFKKFLGIIYCLYILFLIFGIVGSATAEEWACTCGTNKPAPTGSTPENCALECYKIYNISTCNCNALASLPTNSETDEVVTITNPLGKITSPQVLIGKIINAVLGVVGSLTLLMFVYGGLVWMTSSGSAEKIKQGREIIVWSAIGLAIIFSAYGLIRIFLTTLK
ncbi:MAG: pilin [Patescibacteria group bacterium]|jgi:hypothetical protein